MGRTKLLFVGVHELDRRLVDPIKDALLDFELPLLVLFIRAVDLVLTPFVVKCIVTFVAQTLRINLAVSVSTLRSFVISTVHVVAIVAHTLGIMLLVMVRAISDLRDFASLANNDGLLEFVLHDLSFFSLAGNLVFNRKGLYLLDLRHPLRPLVVLNELLEL